MAGRYRGFPRPSGIISREVSEWSDLGDIPGMIAPYPIRMMEVDQVESLGRLFRSLIHRARLYNSASTRRRAGHIGPWC